MGRVAFWTVTLPDETAYQLLDRDLWPQFQSRLRDLLARALKRRGFVPRVVGVVELHPARSSRSGRPVPHLHVMFEGSRQRWRGWALTVADLDGLIRDAVRYVGLPAPDVRSAGNVQPVRRNCAAYLAKYLVKNSDRAALKGFTDPLPRVWWFWTAPLRREVAALTLRVSWGFVGWLMRQGPERLEQLGVKLGRYQLDDPRAPVTCWAAFRSWQVLRRAPSIYLSELFSVSSGVTWLRTA